MPEQPERKMIHVEYTLFSKSEETTCTGAHEDAIIDALADLADDLCLYGIGSVKMIPHELKAVEQGTSDQQ